MEDRGLFAEGVGRFVADPEVNSPPQTFATQTPAAARAQHVNAVVCYVAGDKRHRNSMYTDCDTCKRRKVKCDGGDPCSYCTTRKVKCVYSQRMAPNKRQKSATGDVVRAQPSREQQLNSSHARQYYWNLYMQNFNPVFQMFAEGHPALQPTNPSNEFIHATSSMFVARALGHRDVADFLYEQSRRLAGDLIDSFTPNTAIGFITLAAYFFGENHPKAMHYTQLAQSISQNAPQSKQTQQVQAIVAASRILEGLHRPCDREQRGSEEPEEFPGESRRFTITFVWGSPPCEMVLHAARRFPVDCEILDLFCAQRLVRRYNPAQRNNEFLSISRMSIFFDYVQKAYLHMLDGARGPGDLVKDAMELDFSLIQSCCAYMCAAGGLVDLGCAFAARALDAMNRIPQAQAGFLFVSLLTPALLVSAFVSLYKIHPRGPEHDYREVYAELLSLLHPISEMFMASAALVKVLAGKLYEDPNASPAFLPRPGQASIVSQWTNLHEMFYMLAGWDDGRSDYQNAAPSSFTAYANLSLPTMPREAPPMVYGPGVYEMSYGGRHYGAVPMQHPHQHMPHQQPLPPPSVSLVTSAQRVPHTPTSPGIPNSGTPVQRVPTRSPPQQEGNGDSEGPSPLLGGIHAGGNAKTHPSMYMPAPRHPPQPMSSPNAPEPTGFPLPHHVTSTAARSSSEDSTGEAPVQAMMSAAGVTGERAHPSSTADHLPLRQWQEAAARQMDDMTDVVSTSNTMQGDPHYEAVYAETAAAELAQSRALAHAARQSLLGPRGGAAAAVREGAAMRIPPVATTSTTPASAAAMAAAKPMMIHGYHYAPSALYAPENLAFPTGGLVVSGGDFPLDMSGGAGMRTPGYGGGAAYMAQPGRVMAEAINVGVGMPMGGHMPLYAQPAYEFDAALMHPRMGAGAGAGRPAATSRGGPGMMFGADAAVHDGEDVDGALGEGGETMELEPMRMPSLHGAMMFPAPEEDDDGSGWSGGTA